MPCEPRERFSRGTRTTVEPPLYQAIEEALAGDEEHDFGLRQKINRARLEYLDRQSDK